MNSKRNLSPMISGTVLKGAIPAKTMQEHEKSQSQQMTENAKIARSIDDNKSIELKQVQILQNAADRIRTCEGTKPQAPEACPFGHFGTAAQQESRLRLFIKLTDEDNPQTSA